MSWQDSDQSPFFRCFDCGARLFLIRGSCEFCEPELHRQYWAEYNAVAAATDAFERETGKSALGHWNEFEQWCERRA